jgi:hypothetical protein
MTRPGMAAVGSKKTPVAGSTALAAPDGFGVPRAVRGRDAPPARTPAG